MAVQQADLVNAFAELAKLSTEELKELCNSPSDEKYDELVNQSDKVSRAHNSKPFSKLSLLIINNIQVKSLENEREMLMAAVRSLAEFNLARQNDYESDRSKLLESVGDSNKLKEDIQAKATKLLELSKRTSLDSTLAVVLEATTQAEEESENIAKAFLNNTLDFDSFVNQYSEKRKLAHMRRIKADRLRQETNESWTGIRSQSFGHLSQ